MRSQLTIGLTLLLMGYGSISRGQSAKTFYPLGWGAYSRTFTNVFSGVHNQASLAALKSFSFGVFVQQRFSLKDFRQYQFVAALPTKSGSFSLQGSLSGYSRFQRQRINVAYARKLASWCDIGMQLDYMNMHVPHYGSADAFTFVLAALFHINKQWHVGFQTFNPEQVAYHGLGNDRLPAVYQAGVGYQPSKLLLLTAEVCRIGSEQTLLRLAFQYHIIKALSIRSGVSTGSEYLFAGVNIHLHRLEIALSTAYHKRLGMTPGAGFIFQNNADP